MKCASTKILRYFSIALVLALGHGVAIAQSPYDDTYVNKSSIKKNAEQAKRQREIEEQRQKEYEQWANSQNTKKDSERGQGGTAVKRPEDFASYAEYREYLDGLGQPSRSTVTHQNTQESSQQGATVINQYIVSQTPATTSTTTIVHDPYHNSYYNSYYNSCYNTCCNTYYDPFWDSPSLTMSIFFDPWYCSTYHYSYPSHTPHIWYDPWYDYGWYDPWWSSSYSYKRGFRDGYIAGRYSHNYYYPYYPQYYDGGTLYIPSERVVYGARRSSTSSMAGYGQVQRSATAQQYVRMQGNGNSYYRTSDQGSQNTNNSSHYNPTRDYTPTYTRPENGNSRQYNNSWQQTTRGGIENTQNSSSYQAPTSPSQDNSYNNSYYRPQSNTQTYTPSRQGSYYQSTRGGNDTNNGTPSSYQTPSQAPQNNSYNSTPYSRPHTTQPTVTPSTIPSNTTPTYQSTRGGGSNNTSTPSNNSNNGSRYQTTRGR
ncbi:MAG: hypothetical protein ACTTKZ_06305 [Bacteroides sp.]